MARKRRGGEVVALPPKKFRLGDAIAHVNMVASDPGKARGIVLVWVDEHGALHTGSFGDVYPADLALASVRLAAWALE